ncbi:uncharacterized protein LOC106014242 [Aplysia californica]|uniref:Uncharacterized protein LOC106014242 n=1 Tax=Aplysia californica TaxID=6500 RepID=A0ABM1VNQ3_APLCA|nr:uncharacterized protein LOC106014242 [Aplysia californica]
MSGQLQWPLLVKRAKRVIWGCSLQNKMRNTSLIGDGDSKSSPLYWPSTPMIPYSEGGGVCHPCGKRSQLCTLQNLRAIEKKRGVTLGERAFGILTQEKIGCLQSYYTKPLRLFNSFHC